MGDAEGWVASYAAKPGKLWVLWGRSYYRVGAPTLLSSPAASRLFLRGGF